MKFLENRTIEPRYNKKIACFYQAIGMLLDLIGPLLGGGGGN